MPAHESLNGIQFSYEGAVDRGEKYPMHVLLAKEEGGMEIGHMHWNARSIGNIEVEPEHQRRGIATGLWQEAQRLAAENKDIPQPKHSSDRTKSGNAWAKSVGGRLPRRRR